MSSEAKSPSKEEIGQQVALVRRFALGQAGHQAASHATANLGLARGDEFRGQDADVYGRAKMQHAHLAQRRAAQLDELAVEHFVELAGQTPRDRRAGSS